MYAILSGKQHFSDSIELLHCSLLNIKHMLQILSERRACAKTIILCVVCVRL